MTRDRAKELAPIIQAYAEGKKVEYRAPYARTWTAIENPEWADCHDYRVAAEPKKRPMTRGEILYKITTTPAMVARFNAGDPVPATLTLGMGYSFERLLECAEWAYVSPSGEPLGDWHKFEVEE